MPSYWGFLDPAWPLIKLKSSLEVVVQDKQSRAGVKFGVVEKA